MGTLITKNEISTVEQGKEVIAVAGMVAIDTVTSADHVAGSEIALFRATRHHQIRQWVAVN